MEHGRADSRAKAAQHNDPVLRHATSEGLDGNAALISQEPSLRDLAETLVFSPSDGRIWLNDQRMILLQSASLGVLRRELIESLGTEKARQLLTRIGYASGSRDAELIRRRWPQGDAFRAGPHIHSLEGVVKVTPLRLAMDVDQGSFEGEFLWEDSSEASQHVAVYGISSAPVCWMQIGYASGFASALMGKMVIYREVECHAMGAPNCRCIGRTADAWENVEEDLPYFTFGELPRAEAPRAPTRQSASDCGRRRPAGDGWHLARFPRGAAHARSRGADPGDRAFHRGVGRRQGTVLPRAPCHQPARRKALRRGQLRGHSRYADRGRSCSASNAAPMRAPTPRAPGRVRALRIRAGPCSSTRSPR